MNNQEIIGHLIDDLFNNFEDRLQSYHLRQDPFPGSRTFWIEFEKDNIVKRLNFKIVNIDLLEDSLKSFKLEVRYEELLKSYDVLITIPDFSFIDEIENDFM